MVDWVRIDWYLAVDVLFGLVHLVVGKVKYIYKYNLFWAFIVCEEMEVNRLCEFFVFC